MTMTPEVQALINEKLARVVFIHEEKKKFDYELAQLLGIIRESESAPLVKQEVKETPATKPKHTSECSECGSKSKHKAACSRPEKSDTLTPKGCELCGARGYRHYKGCKLEGRARSADSEIEAFYKKQKNMVSDHQFQQIKIATTHGVPPETIATEMRLSEETIKNALLAGSYEQYAAE